jgi:TPR repeat protein
LRTQVEIGHGSWKTLKSSQRREMKEVIRMWTEAATEQRSAHAQFMMGCLHDRDVEFDKRVLRADMKEGAIWLKKAAKQGHAIALYKLGFMYSGGIGVDKDQQESSKWFLKSAAQGYDRAQFSVGVIFLHGEGVKEDKKEALQWFLKAAEQGHSKAQFNAAALYFLHGVDGHASWHPDRTSDLIEAARWYRKAAGQGCAQSQYSLASMYLNGLGGLEVDETKALKLTALAAKNGNALAQKFLDSHVKDAHLSEPPHEPASSTT